MQQLNASNQSSHKSFQIKQMIKKICENKSNGVDQNGCPVTSQIAPMKSPLVIEESEFVNISSQRPVTYQRNMPIVARDSKTIEHTNMIENSINDSSKTTKKIPDLKNNNSDRIEILRHPK